MSELGPQRAKEGKGSVSVIERDNSIESCCKPRVPVAEASVYLARPIMLSWAHGRVKVRVRSSKTQKITLAGLFGFDLLHKQSAEAAEIVPKGCPSSSTTSALIPTTMFLPPTVLLLPDVLLLTCSSSPVTVVTLTDTRMGGL